jgi:hypothetical protein
MADDAHPGLLLVRILARRQLPVGRPDLPARQPAAARHRCALAARQAAPARALGHHAGAELHLRAPEPRIKQHDLDMIYVAGPATAGRAGGQHLPRGHLQRGLPRRHADEGHARCSASSRSPAASPATSRPRRPGRSTRAASSATRWPRLRRRLRQPRPDRRLRRRRRRGRDRAAGRELALQQVPQPGRDGAVLPILHLNGYKIANPTVLARISHEELLNS